MSKDPIANRELSEIEIEERMKNQEETEKEIEDQKEKIDYDTREIIIEYIIDKYLKGADKDDNEIYVPDYQREFIWNDYQQSRFIESIILGLPVPLIMLAEMPSTGRLEIVDGSQRIRTLAAFKKNQLVLKGLKKLKTLNGLRFEHLANSRKRKFNHIALRMIVISGKATKETRNDMFDRINTSSVPLCSMETRRGIYKGDFANLLYKLSREEKFKKMCPISKHFENRREEEELILRFFAFYDSYPHFKLDDEDNSSIENNGVSRFLDAYLNNANKKYKNCLKEKEELFTQMLMSVDKAFPNQGFRKKIGYKQTSRAYFEAIAVGTALALKERPNLKIGDMSWATYDKKKLSNFFALFQGKYHSHTPKKIQERIEYVRDNILKNAEN
ncbi:DUF262 domain-containing protein [Desulfobaculum bizertense]|uniref:DUF262 domain-containing protein n=1 Tax=Desulfobaculum bizertense TaxID=376490 RepID=UPI001F390E39|nr:DUF262 domain-containing protein [Desulfobaculum bizertense]UIJ38507.1 DUF262 domain-containing protein [Desulfobaculum bizertense]